MRRYGSKGAPHYVRYWVLSDEWACGGYWKNNYRKFASYYASQVRLVKAFNPELIVGGPVDCWPNDTITAELLRQCPELDFIAWNRTRRYAFGRIVPADFFYSQGFAFQPGTGAPLA